MGPSITVGSTSSLQNLMFVVPHEAARGKQRAASVKALGPCSKLTARSNPLRSAAAAARGEMPSSTGCG